MKKILMTLVLLVGIVFGLFAQKLTYQAAIRDNSHRLVTNTAVKATVTITFTTGTPATYSEEVNGTTNLHGLLSIEFGDGTLLGRDWTDATIAVRVVNVDDESTVYVGGDARPVSAVPYALSVNGTAIQQYLTEHKYVTADALDSRHYLTSDSAVIIAMQGNIATNKADITTNTADIAALAGRMNTFNTNVCDSVKNCDFSGNTSIQNMLQQLEDRIAALSQKVDSLAALIPGGDTTEVPDGQPCPGAPTVSDGTNTYNTVKIGNQCWMKENLRTTTKRNNVGNIYTNNHTGGYIAETYGYYYDWAAVMQNESSGKVRGICPEGWHVPSDAEWDTLTTYVNSVANYKCNNGADNIANALSAATGWTDASDCNAGSDKPTRNKTGFSAVPAGYYYYGYYDDFGSGADFWSATQCGSGLAYSRYLGNSSPLVDRNNYDMRNGFSVRCLRDEGGSSATLPTVTTASVTNITHNSATSGGDVTADGGANVTARGVCWSTNQNPTIADSHTADSSGTGSFSSSITGLSPNTTYYVRAYATNSVGTSYGTQGSFTTQPFTCGTSTVTDYDNNTYNTVKIGNQCWMKENLRTKLGTDGDKGYPTGAGADSLLYGRLYTWSAMMNSKASSDAVPSGVQGICPTGWHVPSDAEWTQLTTYVNSVADYKCNKVDNNIANALSSPTGWQEPSSCGAGHNSTTRNLTGFSAVPAGRYFDGSFRYFGGYASFWSATQDEDRFAWCRNLYSTVSGVSRLSDYKNSGFSVRCLKDN